MANWPDNLEINFTFDKNREMDRSEKRQQEIAAHPVPDYVFEVIGGATGLGQKHAHSELSKISPRRLSRTNMDIAVFRTLQFVTDCTLGYMLQMTIGITIVVKTNCPSMPILVLFRAMALLVEEPGSGKVTSGNATNPTMLKTLSTLTGTALDVVVEAAVALWG